MTLLIVGSGGGWAIYRLRAADWNGIVTDEL
jgi:hypothetical protein